VNERFVSANSLIAFMVWMSVILIGAEMDAEMEHQTVRTIGQPKPLGSRGATMADTVGAAQD
jgi:membrane protein